MMRIMRGVIMAAVAACAAVAGAEVPATPVMTVYQFNGPLSVPYYDVEQFVRVGATAPAGSLSQGTAVVPCLVVRDGEPVTDRDGTPYVGFEIVVDADTATPASTARFEAAVAARKDMRVANHHCPRGTRHVIDVRKLHPLGKPPRFDPPPAGAPAGAGARGELDAIVRAFHASTECAAASRRLIGRREALRQAWDRFIDAHADRWSAAGLQRARQLDYVMRTAIYEGHLGRGCSAYGACERNVIALSIRNRGVERCLRGQGCRRAGDFEGVSSAVSQYNIWDEYLTQTSGLTLCFLRPDLAADPQYARLQAMYAQSAADVEAILFGGPRQLAAVFPGSDHAELARLRHYYHPPAMGKCFPEHERLEYISAAVARRGGDFLLIANTRVRVDERGDDGYAFRQAVITETDERDEVGYVDRYPGFRLDARKVTLARPARCAPYGTPRGCDFERIGRYRRTPPWLAEGDPIRLTCRVRARGEDCRGEPRLETARVGGVCDTRMQPIAGVR